MHVRGYFDSSKVRGEVISVILINQEILPGPEEARMYLFHIFNDNEGFR